MIYAFLIGGVGITVRHWVEPPDAGEECGARLEIQRIEEEPPEVFYAASARCLRQPVLRADLFTRIAGAPGNWDAAHYHPRFDDRWIPCDRVWDPQLTSNPDGWLRTKLQGLRGTLQECGAPDLAETIDQAAVDRALPHIMAAVEASQRP
jgi:hypothetical protein